MRERERLREREREREREIEREVGEAQGQRRIKVLNQNIRPIYETTSGTEIVVPLTLVNRIEVKPKILPLFG